MLPFLKKPKSVGIAMEYRKPDLKPDSEPMEDDGLEMAAEELSKAISQGDKKAAAKALRAAFHILDAEPHEEGPHIEDEDSHEE